MVRKLVMTGIFLLIGGLVVTQTKLGSYIGTLWNKAVQTAEENVPPEVELERVQYQLDALSEDVGSIKSALATERVIVGELTEETVALREKLAKEEPRIQARGEQLKVAEEAANKFVKLENGRTIPYEQAKKELDHDVKSFNRQRTTLEKKERTLAAHTRKRDVLERQLKTIMEQRAESQAALDEMKTELELLKLEQMESEYQSDNTRLADIKQTLKKVGRRIAIERERVRIAQEYDPEKSNKSVDEILSEMKSLDDEPVTD